MATYSNPPARIDYMEGIATPMGILKFHGAGSGEITLKDGFLTHSIYHDSSRVILAIDIDTVPEEITRLVTTDITPIPVTRVGKYGGRVIIKELETRRDTIPESKMPMDMRMNNGVEPSQENPKQNSDSKSQ
jgi:hypothetical protein